MKRQRFQADRVNYEELFDDPDTDGGVALGRISGTVPRKENHIVAQINGETLQAICLRYNCSLAELKRLNKIEKEIEIHARSTIRIPITPYTVLLDTLPGVHSSGSSSPKHATTAQSLHQLEKNATILDEKLLIAAISSSSGAVDPSTSTINDIILDSKIAPSAVQPYHDDPRAATDSTNRDRLPDRVPLLSGDIDDTIPQPRPIPVRHRFEINFNGTDCDMSWVCLFIFILLLCVAIPLIYVFWTVEHVDHLHHLHDNVEQLHGLMVATAGNGTGHSLHN